MSYSVYKKINKKEFINLKENLETIERLISPIKQLRGYFLNRDGYYEENLGLDYLHEDYKFMGNIGVRYEEESSSAELKLFSFYILKSKEEKDVLFYMREKLERYYTIDEIVTNYVSLFENCLNIYDSISEDMLIQDDRSIS